MENRDNVKEKEDKEVFVLELLSEIKRQSKRWMIAFFVVLALWAATIAGFVLFLNQYEFESYTQDGSGYNNVNTGEQGDVVNGAEIPENEKQNIQSKQFLKTFYLERLFLIWVLTCF